MKDVVLFAVSYGSLGMLGLRFAASQPIYGLALVANLCI